MRSFFHKKHSASLQTFCRTNWFFRSIHTSPFETNLPNKVPKCQRWRLLFFLGKNSNSSKFLQLKPRLYLSFTDIVETPKLLPKEKQSYRKQYHSHIYSSNAKSKNYIAKIWSSFAFFSTDYGRIFEINAGNEFWLTLGRKGPHEAEFSHDVFCIRSPVIYTDLIEHIFVGATDVPILHCFPYISKPRDQEVITAGHCMKYQIYNNKRIRLLLDIFFHFVHFE